MAVDTDSAEKGVRITIPILAAFLGALIAFILNILWKWVEANYRREAVNWNGLVKLSLVMDDNGALNNLNIVLCEEFLKHLQTVWPPIIPFKQLEVDRDVLLEINNLDLLNDIRILNYDMKRSNAFLNNLDTWFSGFKTELLKGKVPPELEKRCKENITKDLKFWLVNIRSLDADVELTISKIRGIMKETSTIIWFVKKSTRTKRYSQHFEKVYSAELVQVRAERQKMKEVNKSKMDRMEEEAKII